MLRTIKLSALLALFVMGLGLIVKGGGRQFLGNPASVPHDPLPQLIIVRFVHGQRPFVDAPIKIDHYIVGGGGDCGNAAMAWHTAPD
jgi:hypothetical protein